MCFFTNKKSDKELENLGLSKEEKKAYRNGGYDKFNFEEEELEDDDYYGEDE